MDYIKEPVEERPWYKKPLVLGTIAAALLLITGSVYLVIRWKKTTLFTNIPSIQDDNHRYKFGLEASAVLVHMYNLSKPGGKFRKGIEPIVRELASDPKTSNLQKLMAKSRSSFLGCSVNSQLQSTALLDLSKFFEGLNIPMGNYLHNYLSPGQEFHVVILGKNQSTLKLDRVSNGRAIAYISQRGVFLRNMNEELWHNDRDTESLYHDSAMNRMSVKMIVYQQTPEQERN